MKKPSIIILLQFLALGFAPVTGHAQAFTEQNVGKPAMEEDETGSASTTTDAPRCHKKATCDTCVESKQSPYDLSATILTGMPYIKDDNAAGFTQTYLETTFWRTPRPCKYRYEFALFKTFFMQAYFSSNSGSANVFNNTIGTVTTNYVNKVDLYQHANSNINLHEDLLYFHFPKKRNNLWETQLFWDVMATYLRTNVTDTIQKNTTNMDSWLIGTNLSASFKNNNNILQLPVSFLLTGEVFWLNPMSNSYHTDLGFQYANSGGDKTNAYNTNMNLTSATHPYFHFDGQVQFIISKQPDPKNPQTDPKADAGSTTPKPTSNNRLFLHVGYTTELYRNTSKEFYNSYFQAQIGISIDIINSIKNYKPKS